MIKVAEVIDSSSATAYKIIADFESLELLTKITHSQRSKLYIFESI